MFLANFLIALREGTEATLIVGILVAYLVKVNRRDVLPAMWVGVALAAIIPLSAGAYMTWGPYTLTFQAQEILGGGLSLIAVGLVTWMIFWMGKNASRLSSELEGSAAKALESGSKWGLVWVAILSVGREGVETALMVWATVKSSAQTAVMAPALGVVAGIACSIVIGYLVYKGSAAINLRLFFNITGYLLIFVAAGIVCYGIGDFQEAAVIPGWGTYLYDGTSAIVGVVSSVWFVLLNAFFNIQYLFSPTHAQFFCWLAYLVITLVAFTRMIRSRSASTPTDVPADVAPRDALTQATVSEDTPQISDAKAPASSVSARAHDARNELAEAVSSSRAASGGGLRRQLSQPAR